jgi:hypothetical protein
VAERTAQAMIASSPPPVAPPLLPRWRCSVARPRSWKPAWNTRGSPMSGMPAPQQQASKRLSFGALPQHANPIFVLLLPWHARECFRPGQASRTRSGCCRNDSPRGTASLLWCRSLLSLLKNRFYIHGKLPLANWRRQATTSAPPNRPHTTARCAVAWPPLPKPPSRRAQ